jgi:hypothetical protein
MIYLVAGLLALFVCFSVILLVEQQSIKGEIEQLTWLIRFNALTAEAPEIADEHVTPEAPSSQEPLTDAEILRLEREAEFDLRIAKMKDELADRLPLRPMYPTEAEVLHPLVQNLPHNIIPDTYDNLPDVEFTQ